MKKRYASIKEVSEYTSLSVKTLYDWASQGKMPTIKCGRRMLFDLVEIDRAMESLKRNNDKNTKEKIIGEIFGGNV